MELDRAVDPGRQSAVGIGDVDLGQQCARPWLQRIGNPADHAVELAIGEFGHAHDGVDAGSHAEGGVLRHIGRDADDAFLHDLEHEGAARRVTLHQTPDIDVSLGDDAVERRDHRGILAVLTELLDLILLRGDIVCRAVNRRIAGFEGLQVDVALLTGDPAFLNQIVVSVPGHLCEPLASLRLIQRRLELLERCLVLRNLVIELRYGELRQQIARLDAIPDVYVALGDIAGRAGVDVRRGEGGGCAGQVDRKRVGARFHRCNLQGWHSITLVLGSRGHLSLLRKVIQRAQREAAGEEHKSSQREQPPAPSPARPLAISGRFLDVWFDVWPSRRVAVDHIASVTEIEIIHWGDPRTRHRLRRRRCSCAASQTDTGR